MPHNNFICGASFMMELSMITVRYKYMQFRGIQFLRIDQWLSQCLADK
jgi:hypothetical protein